MVLYRRNPYGSTHKDIVYKRVNLKDNQDLHMPLKASNRLFLKRAIVRRIQFLAVVILQFMG